MSFRVLLDRRRAEGYLKNLPRSLQARIKAALRRLADDPFAAQSGADIKYISNDPEGHPVLRLRVGDYPCVYVVAKGQVQVTKIFHRSEEYDWMRRLGLA